MLYIYLIISMFVNELSFNKKFFDSREDFSNLLSPIKMGVALYLNKLESLSQSCAKIAWN